jgi:outer membrane protein assembly factor BamA
MSIGSSAYSRKVDYAMTAATTDYSEVRSGANVTSGLAWRRFTRLFFTYGYEIIDTAMTDALSKSLTGAAAGGVVLTQEGRFTESRVTPSIVYNTVDNPFAPRQGMRLSATYQYAGGWLGGTNRFVRPELQGILYVPDAPHGTRPARQCRRHLNMSRRDRLTTSGISSAASSRSAVSMSVRSGR